MPCVSPHAARTRSLRKDSSNSCWNAMPRLPMPSISTMQYRTRSPMRIRSIGRISEKTGSRSCTRRSRISLKVTILIPQPGSGNAGLHQYALGKCEDQLTGLRLGRRRMSRRKTDKRQPELLVQNDRKSWLFLIKIVRD